MWLSFCLWLDWHSIRNYILRYSNYTIQYTQNSRKEKVESQWKIYLCIYISDSDPSNYNKKILVLLHRFLICLLKSEILPSEVLLINSPLKHFHVDQCQNALGPLGKIWGILVPGLYIINITFTIHRRNLRS